MAREKVYRRAVSEVSKKKREREEEKEERRRKQAPSRRYNSSLTVPSPPVAPRRRATHGDKLNVKQVTPTPPPGP